MNNELNQKAQELINREIVTPMDLQRWKDRNVEEWGAIKGIVKDAVGAMLHTSGDPWSMIAFTKLKTAVIEALARDFAEHGLPEDQVIATTYLQASSSPGAKLLAEQYLLSRAEELKQEIR